MFVHKRGMYDLYASSNCFCNPCRYLHVAHRTDMVLQMDVRNAFSSTRSQPVCLGYVTASTRTMSTPPPSQ